MIFNEQEQLEISEKSPSTERSFLKLINNLPASVSKMDFRTKKYNFVNTQFEITTGLSLNELNNASPGKLLTFVHRNDIKKTSDSINRWLNENMNDVHNLEYRGYDANGKMRWYNTFLYAEFNKNKEPESIIQVDMDITDRKEKEIEISRSESLLNSLMNNIQHSIWSVDKNYRLVKHNDTFEKIMMNIFDVQVYPGMLIVESIRDEKRIFKELWYDLYKRALKGESFTTETEFEFNGEKRFVLVSMNPIFVGNEITGLTAFSHDITNMKKNREMLLESENRYQIIIDNLNEGILITDKNDILLFCNKACENIFGIKKDEMIGLDLKNFHDDKNKLIIKKQNNLRAQGISTSYEMDIIRNDNTKKTIFVSASPRYDKSGAFNGSYVVALDIDDKKRSELQLLENEQKLRAITENINCLLWIYDEDLNKVIYANNYYNSLFGSDVEELYNDPESWLKYLYPGDKEYYHINKNSRPAEGLTYRIIKNENEVRWLNSKVFPLNSGNGKRIVGIAEDITPIKEKEKQLENAKLNAELANRAKSDFLAIMSHEIRTPLNGISGFTQLMQDTPLSETQKEYIDLIRSSSSKLLRVINDILDFSKLAAGKLTFECNNFNLKEAITKSIQIIEPSAKDRGLKIISDIPDELPEIISGDAERLQQVFLNLLSNSVKFSENSDIIFSVKIRSVDSEKIKLKFSIKDSGIGISTDAQKLLFKPFVQGDTTSVRKYGGTGLGLAICKDLVEMMNGEIGVESEPDKGSVFSFTAEFLLNKPQINSNKDITMIKNNSGDEKTGESYNILVVEDEVINQKLVKKILEKYGHTVLVCSNGAEAIENLDTLKFDIILMDIQMPVMNGIEATIRIRKAEKKTKKRIPIIAMTANAFLSDKEKCFSVGMDEFISKPININEMLQKINMKISEALKKNSKAS